MEPLEKQYLELKAMNLNIDMTRGKPSNEQLALSGDLMTMSVDFIGKDGVDIRNYGVLKGTIEARELMGELMEEDPACVLAIGSSSLTLMYDTVQRAMQFGVCGSEPWNALGKVKFLCPVPGYDRHFSICENFGIEMINVEMTEDGPDLDFVEDAVANDEAIKGIWCVPQYSNPTGVTYSDEVVKRLASMSTKASDFRIFWDNAYCVHHLTDDDSKKEHVLDIAKACASAGHENRYFKFASLSKVTFPGAAVAAFASSEANLNDELAHLNAQMIGSDKINQMKHVKFLKDKQGVLEHMEKHADIMRPKFEAVQEVLSEELACANWCSWSKPNGGYFISFNCMEGTAKRVVQIAEVLGVKFTKAGATYPHLRDPKDKNIRIAPSLPSVEEVRDATRVLAIAARIAAKEIEENNS